MSKKPNIDVTAKTKSIIAEAIGKALAIAEAEFHQRKLKYNNAIGLLNLNYIFSEIEKYNDHDFFAYKVKRGCYEFVLIVDKSSKTLITLSSKANIQRLRNRIVLKNYHYVDALLSTNTNYEGDYVQGSFFDDLDFCPEEDKRAALFALLTNIIECNAIEKYVLCEYEISHKQFRLQRLNLVLFSENFVELKRESLHTYINYSYETLTEETLNVSEIDEGESKLDIKVKNIAVKSDEEIS